MRFFMSQSVVRKSLTFTLAVMLCLAAAAHAGHHDAAGQKKVGILMVSFGSSVPEARAAYDNIEARVKQAFPDVPVFQAFTSNIIRRKLLKEDNLSIDSPAEALARMMAQGFTHVAIQSTHVIPGEEYEGLVRTAAAFEGMPKGMTGIEVGLPLLGVSEDCERVAKAMLKLVPAQRKAGEAVIFMGHGTHHIGNIYYPGMQYYFGQLDPNVFVGTVEGTPSLDDVIKALKARKIRTAYVLPFMTVAGDHAQNDMAGDEDDSWKSILTREGIRCVPVVKGLGLSDALADVWVDHLKDAMSRL